MFYICVLFLSATFLFVGNRIASGGIDFASEIDAFPVYSAVVTEITDRVEDTQEFAPGFSITNISIKFYARITSGELRGEEVFAEYIVSSVSDAAMKEVETGDRILLMYDNLMDSFIFMEYERVHYIAILGAAFFMLIVLFGRKKGFNSIIALGFACFAIFMVFVPAILSGKNIYITAAIICAYSIISTLLIVIGPNKKAISAIFGCLGGVLFAGLLMISMDTIMNLTGFVDQEARFLLHILTENPIDLRAIIFAGVVIGSAGAIMDVAMSIASSLWEVKLAGGAADFRSLFKSGIEIGKDILGTMLNTLILAYIGSSLSVILLLTAHTTSLIELFNMEMIIVEFLRALVGSFGMFLTIPLTAAICGWLYVDHQNDDGFESSDDDYYERLKLRRNMRTRK